MQKSDELACNLWRIEEDGNLYGLVVMLLIRGILF